MLTPVLLIQWKSNNKQLFTTGVQKNLLEITFSLLLKYFIFLVCVTTMASQLVN